MEGKSRLEAKLVYNYFRDYDPELGRYIQSDPIGLAGGIELANLDIRHVDAKKLTVTVDFPDFTRQFLIQKNTLPQI